MFKPSCLVVFCAFFGLPFRLGQAEPLHERTNPSPSMRSLRMDTPTHIPLWRLKGYKQAKADGKNTKGLLMATPKGLCNKAWRAQVSRRRYGAGDGDGGAEKRAGISSRWT